MPVYTYQIVNADGSPGETIELIHKMTDKPLTRHPDTGQSIKRIYTAPHIAGETSGFHDRTRLKDKNLEKQGFTTYRRNGKGHYERTTGSEGPAHINVAD